MLFQPGELSRLAALRERFLNPSAGAGPYWRSSNELALFDRTFGERIGWKWDAVLRELLVRGWHPASQPLVDWGCGSGIAGRRLLQRFPGQFTELKLHDSSSLARAFAADAVAGAFPGLAVNSSHSPEIPEGSLVVLSHVMNELTDSQAESLLRAIQVRAAEFIWVESGTHENSRRFIANVRERLLATGTFGVLAPCTHESPCGMFTARNARHWCHSFAVPPSSIFQDPGWMELSRTLRIDLRSVPYSFLAMQRRPSPPPPSDAARVIGHPRDYKGYSKILSCESSGVHDRMLQKRDAPALLKDLQQGAAAPIYQWRLAGERIAGGSPLD